MNKNLEKIQVTKKTDELTGHIFFWYQVNTIRYVAPKTNNLLVDQLQSYNHYSVKKSWSVEIEVKHISGLEKKKVKWVKESNDFDSN